jgi:putative peptidoglycan lipid II flippase
MLLFRRPVILMSAPAADPFRMELAAGLALVIFPSLVLTVGLALLESILNAEGQFGWPAYAGLLVPLASAISVLVAGKSLGVVTLGIGTLIGLCLQGGAFIIRLRRARLHYRPILDVHNPALGPLMRVAWPALLASVISGASPLIDQMFASALSAGSISALNYALKLISVPTGVIFAAVGRAALPHLSRQAGLHQMRDFKSTLRLYLWVVGIGTVLLTALMLVLAHPLVQVLFQRGAFSAADTDHTAITLIGFVVGLLPLALNFLLADAFCALGKTRVNMSMAVFGLSANALFDYLLSRLWGSLGIALATSAIYACGLPIWLFTLRRMIGNLDLLTPPPELLRLLHAARSGLDTAPWRTR